MARRRRDKSAMKPRECLAVALNCAGAVIFPTLAKSRKFKPARNICRGGPLPPLLDLLTAAGRRDLLRKTNPSE